MTGLRSVRPTSLSRSRIAVLGLSAIAAAIVIAANAHLVAVAFSTQPDCVPHLKAPEEGAAAFRAAMPSC